MSLLSSDGGAVLFCLLKSFHFSHFSTNCRNCSSILTKYSSFFYCIILCVSFPKYNVLHVLGNWYPIIFFKLCHIWSHYPLKFLARPEYVCVVLINVSTCSPARLLCRYQFFPNLWSYKKSDNIFPIELPPNPWASGCALRFTHNKPFLLCYLFFWLFSPFFFNIQRGRLPARYPNHE